MPRRGWSSADAGWAHILRGPRPPAATWPKRTKPPAGPVQGRWRKTHGDQSPVKVCSGGFGTRRLCHESRARGSEACEGARHCSGQDGSRYQDGRSPRACFQVGEGFARFGRFRRSRGRAFAALKRAQKEASSQCGGSRAQAATTPSFVAHSRSNLLVRPWQIPVQRLQAIVVDLQRLEHSGGPTTAVGAARQRSRGNFVPSCVEMQQWIWDRHWIYRKPPWR